MTYNSPPRFFFYLALLCLICAVCTSATTKKPPLRPININTATSGQLQLVPGIGPTTADKILTMLKSYGPFKSVDDLLAIKGLGKKRLDKMRKYLTVGKAVAVNHPQPGSTKQKPAQEKNDTPAKKVENSEVEAPDSDESGQPPSNEANLESHSRADSFRNSGGWDAAVRPAAALGRLW